MHSCVYVIIGPTGDSETLVNEALAPFDEAITVKPYKLHILPSGARAIAEHYHLPETDLRALAKKIPDWMHCRGGVDRLGLFAMKNYNADGRWDWYEIGGRWHGFIHGPSLKSVRSKEGDDNLIAVSDLLAAPDFRDRLPHDVVTPTGEWVTRSEVVNTYSGWYCKEYPEATWYARVLRILQTFPGHRVVCVDIHS
jgi:hypothetical protein